MLRCVIFGGTGYIGTMLARHFAGQAGVEEIILADLKPPTEPLPARTRYVRSDVREPITGELLGVQSDWIFNFAAIHREPGHAEHEYFDTNLRGARHVTAYAESTACPSLFFTSSIASYGPTNGPTSEASPNYPRTPYGITKYSAEIIHEVWQRSAPGRRLVVCRPGVIYGPGDPGNILRMIRAVKRGYFFFPGDTGIRKSYGYIYGLLESISFMMARPEPHLIYNYVEPETETIADLVAITREFLGTRAPVIGLPQGLLVTAAEAIQRLTGGRSPIHPVRVRKAATPTHIIPARLQELGFTFQYGFRRSLPHWKERTPDDFA